MKINPFKKVRLANHILSQSTKRQIKPKTGSTLKFKEITPDLKTLSFARKVRKKGKNLDSLLKANIQMKNLAKDMVKNTLLTAIKEKNKRLLKELLLYLRGYPTLKNTILSYQDQDGNTLLHLAVSTEDDEIFSTFLSLIENTSKFFTAKNQDQDTPLHLAVDLQDSRIAEKLIIHGPKACYSQNKDGDTPLHLAIGHRDIALSQRLIETKPDTGLSKNKDGNTPLHLALELEGEEALGLIEKILSTCSDSIFPKNSDGQTALHLITADMPQAEAKFLLLYGAWQQAVNYLFDNLLQQRKNPAVTYHSKATALLNFGQEISYQFKQDDSDFDTNAKHILNIFSRSLKDNFSKLKPDIFNNKYDAEVMSCPISLRDFTLNDTNIYYLIPHNLLFCFKLPEDQIMLDVFTQESTWLREPFHPDLFIKVSPERTAEG